MRFCLIVIAVFTLSPFIQSQEKDKKAGKKSLLEKQFPDVMKGLAEFPYGRGEKEVAESAAKLFNEAEDLLASKKQDLAATQFVRQSLGVVEEIQKLRMKDKKLDQRYRVVWETKWVVQEVLPKTELTKGHGDQVRKIIGQIGRAHV